MNLPRLSESDLRIIALIRPTYPESECLVTARAIADAQLALIVQWMREQKPVAEVGTMPGTSGFTMACFKADEVPVGTKLYSAPLPASQGDGEVLRDAERWRKLMWADGYVWDRIRPMCEADIELAIDALAAPATTKEAEG